MSNSLWPHRLQYTRLLCPSLSPRICSNSCRLHWWCYLTISSSATPFFCLQSFPASESFPISHFFTLGGQNIGASASASVLPMTIWDWFPLGFTGWISLSPRDTQESSPIPQFRSINSSVLSFLYGLTVASYLTTGKTIALTRRTFVGKVMSLLFNYHHTYASNSEIFRLYVAEWKHNSRMIIHSASGTI